MTKLQELELVKDKAALRECKALMKVYDLEDQLHAAKFDHRLSHGSFLEAMKDYFTEKVASSESKCEENV